MSSNDDFVGGILAWQRDREVELQKRREQIATKPCEIPQSLYLSDEHIPGYPLLWYRDQLFVLRPADDPELPNRFGGTCDWPWHGLGKGPRPHLLLDLCLTSLPLGLPPNSPIRDRLALFHPFKSSQTPELLYRQDADQTFVASKSPKPHRADRDWPYADYPASLPLRGLLVDGPYPVPVEALSPHGGEKVISIQDLPEDADQFLIVIVPACESVLGTSLLGPDAEHEATQIVFIVSPENGAVWTFNQCG